MTRATTGTGSDPFAALGLPARPDLSDEQVRAVWRQIAAATHPDRPDGGDVERYTAASAAYRQLRTGWGRSEAYADLATAAPGYGYAVAGPGRVAAPPLARTAALGRAALLVPRRIYQGRPLRLLARAIVAAGLSLAALHVVPGQPAEPAVIVGLITWFILTARGDLAPPPGR